jgi:oxalate decarboxylase
MFSRRDMLAVSAAGAVMTASAVHAASFGNPDQPPQGAINAKGPGNLRDPGPQNEALGNQFPSAQFPPATDVGGMPIDWASFNNAPKRVQNGGWARQVTQADFAISDTITGVNMRLTAGGIRELHWHQASEWAIMTYGSCRVTVLDAVGRPYVADVNEGDLWYFPAGQPHSLQGLGPDGCEFVICFDDGNASEFNTLLVTDWFAHTPPEVLAKNFGVPAQTFARIPLQDLWIFQGTLPGDLASDRASVGKAENVPPHPFIFRLGSSTPAKENKGGDVRIADSSNFIVSTTIAAALVTVRPGGIREMHWHPNADEWQYYLKGKATHDGVQYRPERQDHGLQSWRHRLRQAQSRALRRECRRHGHAVYRGLQGFALSRGFSVQLADAHAAGAGCPASQCGRGDHREMAGQRPGRHAQRVDRGSRAVRSKAARIEPESRVRTQ